MSIGAGRLMAVEMTLETKGLEEVTAMLETLHDLGSKIGAVELHARTREDGGKNNAEILEFLRESGRDFTAADESDTNEIAKAFADEVERRMGVECSKINSAKFVSKWVASGLKKKMDAFASEMAASALKKAMEKYMNQVADRIDNGMTNNPPFNSELSDSYATYKMNTVGFTHPIGKFTGQLLDNLDSSGTGARNIRLKKS